MVVGQINRVTALTGFSCKEKYAGKFCRDKEEAVLTRWPYDRVSLYSDV